MRAPASIATVALAVLLLSGCLPQQSTVIPPPEPSSTPVFSSDEEALAAATAAYAAYQRGVDLSLATDSTLDLPGVATGVALKSASDSVESFRAEGKKLVGSSSIDTTSIVHLGELNGGPSGDPVQIYGCLDISKTDVVNSAGESLVTRMGTVRVAMLVSLVWSRKSETLLVTEAEVWDGNDFCN